MTVEAQRVHQDVRKGVAVLPRVRSVVDHAFEILGSTAVSGTDIASIFAAASVRMGDSVWVGYVPVGGRLTCRVRLSRWPVQSGGDTVDLTLVLDQKLFHRRLLVDTLASNTHVLIDDDILRRQWSHRSAGSELRTAAEDVALVQPVPLTALAAHIPSFPSGQRMVALGVLTWVYARDPDSVRRLLENELASCGSRTVSAGLRLFEIGWREAPRWVACRFATAPPPAVRRQHAVMNGRRALVSGALSVGMNQCHLAASHPLIDGFGRVFAQHGGRLVTENGFLSHVSADQQSARSRRVAASLRPDNRPESSAPRSGAPMLLIETSGGPRYRKFDAGEKDGDADTPPPRVIIRLERLVPESEPLLPAWFDPLGPSVGCATAATRETEWGAISATGEQREQCVVLAPTTVEECFRFVSVAAGIAGHYRCDVIVLVDALLLGAMQAWTPAPPVDVRIDDGMDDVLFDREAVLWPSTSPSDCARQPFEPDNVRRRVEMLLAHLRLREASLDSFVRPAPVVGGENGDVLLIGWGATRGPVEEAVARLRSQDKGVSALHLRTLHPLPAGLVETMARFRHVVAIDVLTDPFDAAARLRHLTAILRAAAVASAAPNRGETASWLVKRLSSYAFSHERPLSPGAVYDFAVSLAAGP